MPAQPAQAAPHRSRVAAKSRPTRRANDRAEHGRGRCRRRPPRTGAGSQRSRDRRGGGRMSGASLAAAFTAGALSFVTPRCLPLVRGYLAAIGIGDATSARGAPPRDVLRASLPFVLGFGAVFVLLGAGAGALSDALRDYRPELTHAGGIVVVAMGFAVLGLLPLPGLQTNLQPAL